MVVWSKGHRPSARLIATAAIAAVAIALPACSRTKSTAGVENRWRDPDVRFEEGVSTQADVLARLGPPSQIIALRDQTVFYYLNETLRSDRLITFVYNHADRQLTYDRAIFFFDGDGVLSKLSYSQETNP